MTKLVLIYWWLIIPFTVVLKRVELGDIEQGMRAVIKGLDAQDEVITEGLQNASPGIKVTTKGIST